MMIRKYATISGPRIIPRIPKKNQPPIIPINANEELRFAFLEMNNGRNILSIVDENNPKIKIPNAALVFPATIK